MTYRPTHFVGIVISDCYSKIEEVGWLSQYNDILWAGELGFDSQQEQEIFLFSTVARPALRPTQPPTQLVTEALCPRIKWLGHEADQSPSVLRSRMVELYLHCRICLYGVMLN
jgi:hypothetical protein